MQKFSPAPFSVSYLWANHFLRQKRPWYDAFALRQTNSIRSKRQINKWKPGVEYLNELNQSEVQDREIIRANAKVAYDDCVKKPDNLLN